MQSRELKELIEGDHYGGKACVAVWLTHRPGLVKRMNVVPPLSALMADDTLLLPASPVPEVTTSSSAPACYGATVTSAGK